jgi:hypothetical protein
MTHRICRHALHAFVQEAVDRIEATPMPADMAEMPGAGGVPVREWHAVWLAAGIATQIGDVLLEEPELFVEEVPAWPLAGAAVNATPLRW